MHQANNSFQPTTYAAAEFNIQKLKIAAISVLSSFLKQCSENSHSLIESQNRNPDYLVPQAIMSIKKGQRLQTYWIKLEHPQNQDILTTIRCKKNLIDDQVQSYNFSMQKILIEDQVKSYLDLNRQVLKNITMPSTRTVKSGV